REGSPRHNPSGSEKSRLAHALFVLCFGSIGSRHPIPLAFYFVVKKSTGKGTDKNRSEECWSSPRERTRSSRTGCRGHCSSILSKGLEAEKRMKKYLPWILTGLFGLWVVSALRPP